MLPTDIEKENCSEISKIISIAITDLESDFSKIPSLVICRIKKTTVKELKCSICTFEFKFKIPAFYGQSKCLLKLKPSTQTL